MRDKDNCIAFLADAVHMLVQLFTAFLGEGGSGFINNYNFGMEVGGLNDFYQLAILEIVFVNLMLSLDMLEAILLQQFVGLAVDSLSVFNAMLYKLILMA